MKNEEWRQVSINHNYFVSNFGRIKSVRNGKEKILQPCKNPKYYTTVRIGGEMKRVHRLIGLAFGIIKDNEWVNHIDGNKNNNAIENLEKSNPSHNLYHAYKNKLINHVHGKNHPLSKLDDKKAIGIIKMCSKGSTLKEISDKYGVCLSVCSAVARGVIWKHLDKHRKEFNIEPRCPRKNFAEIRKLQKGDV